MKLAVKMYIDEILNKFKTRTTRIISLRITSHCLFDFVVSIDWLQSKTLICFSLGKKINISSPERNTIVTQFLSKNVFLA